MGGVGHRGDGPGVARHHRQVVRKPPPRGEVSSAGHNHAPGCPRAAPDTIKVKHRLARPLDGGKYMR